MAFTKNFVFTDPVAAQQAVQYAQLASQDQAAEAQAFNDRMRIGTQGRISQQNNQQQQMMNQYQMQQRAAENEKDRELARQGYTNAQTVAGIAYGGKSAPVDARLKAQQNADAAALAKQAVDNFAMGNDYAAIINNKTIPDSIKRKFIESGHVTVDQRTGLYVGRYPNPAAESISGILNKRAGMGPSTISVTPMPSPGPRVPSPSDFSVPVEYPGGPSVFTAPRQSDFAVPFDEFLSTDAPPRTKLPGAYLPY